MRVKIFVVADQQVAQQLTERLAHAGVAARPLDPSMLEGENATPLFAGRRAGVLCEVPNDAAATRLDEAYHAAAIDALVLERELQSSSNRTGERLVVVHETGDGLKAGLIKNLLAERGIEALVVGESQFSPLPNLHQAQGAKLLVAARDADAARQILAAQSACGCGAPAGQSCGGYEYDEEEDYDDDPPLTQSGTLLSWPTCPSCGKRRLTVCPICETAGTDFPAADENFADDEDLDPAAARPLAVICTTCDEPWAAEFLRRCEWCGHDFGHGLRMPEIAPVSGLADLDREPLNTRVVAVLLGLGLMSLATLAYFALIMN